MILLYQSFDPSKLLTLRSALEERGIDCSIQDEILSTLAFQLAPTECLPKLFIMDETRLEEARKVLEEWKQTLTSHPAEVDPDAAENEGNVQKPISSKRWGGMLGLLVVSALALPLIFVSNLLSMIHLGFPRNRSRVCMALSALIWIAILGAKMLGENVADEVIVFAWIVSAILVAMARKALDLGGQDGKALLVSLGSGS
ncbi:MAG: DUF2007 domain-containing protein [Planctomycetota bacterium]